MTTPAPPRYSIARHRPQQQSHGHTAIKAPTARLKVIIRRLPPGLTEAELYGALGDDWKLGGERVDWASYKPGKVSKDPAKASRPSRVYLHLTKQEYLAALSDKIQEVQFNDARATGADPALHGSPTVEFAPYTRISNGKVRKDARQGTIDQDTEFIDFLESLTNPLPKTAVLEGVSDTENKKEEVKVTPLIQYLKDKKANKGKETTSPAKPIKHSRSDSKDSKASQSSEKKVPLQDGKEATPSIDKRSASAIKVEKAARDAVKLLNKQAHTSNKTANIASAAMGSPSIATQSPPTPPSVALAERKRERSAVSPATRIQRDLGLTGSPGGRRRREAPAANTTPSPSIANKPHTIPQSQSTPTNNNTTASTAVAVSLSTTAQQTKSSPPTQPSTSTPQAPTGPAASRIITKPALTHAPRSHQTSNQAPLKSSAIAPTSTQAFLKHANPSQGITEPLLSEAFAPFGAIKFVEIDKKKGFAYIDFEEPEGLRKAIAASPVKVAQGQVVVLERKVGPALQARNVRGGIAGAPARGVGGPMVSGTGRGGGPPMVHRGGRGGGVRGRGGFARGAMVGAGQKLSNGGTSADAQSSTAASDAEPAVPAAVTPPCASDVVAPTA